ncbi:MAG: hypothetical protein KatS3mg068_1989 [Candidatus Sericytochromatia bacterium]|nr:MAG: hypothetical protein KatS3mg068_1989 [Candidatus Sericytochromatia bacterium]
MNLHIIKMNTLNILKNSIIEDIRSNIDTKLSLILKPEEQIQMFFESSNLENDAYVNIEFIKNMTNSLENSNTFEKRLIIKNNKQNIDIFTDNIIISSYFYNIKDLISYLYNEKSINYSKGIYDIDDILFLVEFGNVKDINKYSYFLDDNNINKKEKLQLVLEIVKSNYMIMELEKTEYYIKKRIRNRRKLYKY